MSSSLPRRGYLGFEVTAREDATTNEPLGERWYVSQVDAGSPAHNAQLTVGDELLALSSTAIKSLAQLRFEAARCRPGSEVVVEVRRDGQLKLLTMTAAELPLESLTTGMVLLDEVPWRMPSAETVRLRAIWTFPDGEAPYPTVWLLPSATWVSQEVPLSPWDPTYQLVDALTSAGFATLRVDRSGLGDSEGPPCESLDLFHELSMWEAARDVFFASPWVHEHGRLLYGRSLGGMLAPLLAVDQGFSAIAVWGTSSERWHECSMASAARQLALSCPEERAQNSALDVLRRVQELVYLDGLTPDRVYERAPELKQAVTSAFAGMRVHDRTAAFFQQLQQQDLAACWQRVRCPVLGVHAEFDTLTEPEDLIRLTELVGASGRFLRIPHVDHFMHERRSLVDAIKTPWGGSFSAQAAAELVGFFRSRS